MTKYTKKPVSVLLAVMMIFSVFTALPFSVSAEGTDNVAKIGSTEYTTLESAVAAA